MNVVARLRTWWQTKTGEVETPFDGDSTAFAVSLLLHLVLLVGLGLIPLVLRNEDLTLTLMAPQLDPQPVLELPQEFYFDEHINEEIGANSLDGTQMAISVAPTISDISDVPSPVEETEFVGPIEVNETIELATGLHVNENLAIQGAVGQSETGALGAIDRITHEILLSLEERKTLVVWMFDQSGSLARQRQSIHDRMDRIYEELGVIEAAGNPAFARHKDKPLLTAVMAFGKEVTSRMKDPTDNLAEIKEAVRGIEQDNSGIERVFSAVWMAAERFKRYRLPDRETREPDRNVMLIVLTDEAGNDQEGADETVKICRRYEMPVYVVGVPAPFGRRETLVKWVDPDPSFDQTPQWSSVEQGPESFLPERVRLHFSGSREDTDPIDSGFGPFALTRLCYETGGIYFAVHPNRNVNREVRRGETAPYSAHIKSFFDPEVMRRYRPDYVTRHEYERRIGENKARGALLAAARESWITPMESPELRFVKRNEAEFANALTEAQKAAAKLAPRVAHLYDVLAAGEADRDRELTLRWQAGYDLAMGRVLAVKVRTDAYNAMLAQAKRGIKFSEEKNNTWELKPADEVSVGSQLAKSAEKAKGYLERVIREHPDTPWALLAKRELEQPVGWKWTESFTDLSPPDRGNAGGGGGNPAPPRNPQRQMLPKPKPKRSPPPL